MEEYLSSPEICCHLKFWNGFLKKVMTPQTNLVVPPAVVNKSVLNCSILSKNVRRYRLIREDEGNGFFFQCWLPKMITYFCQYTITRCQHAISTVNWQSVDHRIKLWCCHISLIQFLHDVNSFYNSAQKWVRIFFLSPLKTWTTFRVNLLLICFINSIKVVYHR